MRALDRAFRPRSMVQSLTENRQIDTVSSNGRLLHITEPVLDVAEAMFLRQLRRELDHLRRIIDRNDFARVFREQLRQGALSWRLRRVSFSAVRSRAVSGISRAKVWTSSCTRPRAPLRERLFKP